MRPAGPVRTDIPRAPPRPSGHLPRRIPPGRESGRHRGAHPRRRRSRGRDCRLGEGRLTRLRRRARRHGPRYGSGAVTVLATRSNVPLSPHLSSSETVFFCHREKSLDCRGRGLSRNDKMHACGFEMMFPPPLRAAIYPASPVLPGTVSLPARNTRETGFAHKRFARRRAIARGAVKRIKKTTSACRGGLFVT